MKMATASTKATNLGLYGGFLLELEDVFVEDHLGLLEVEEEGHLGGCQKEQGVTRASDAPRRPAHSVNVLLLTVVVAVVVEWWR